MIKRFQLQAKSVVLLVIFRNTPLQIARCNSLEQAISAHNQYELYEYVHYLNNSLFLFSKSAYSR